MARTKKTIICNVTEQERDIAFATYATADAMQAKINAAIDIQFTKIREKNADELSRLQETKDAQFEILQSWAMEHKHEFDKIRSRALTHGVIGFRTGTPKLKTVKGFTWNAVLEVLKVKMKQYVRTTEEIAKDMILANRDNEEVAKDFQSCGFTVVQDETFFVEPKKEDLDK